LMDQKSYDYQLKDVQLIDQDLLKLHLKR
jgi:hypothetical protein